MKYKTLGIPIKDGQVTFKKEREKEIKFLEAARKTKRKLTKNETKDINGMSYERPHQYVKKVC